MTEKRFRMETIGDMMLPFIVDNSTAKKKSDTITTYHTYETHKKEKCLELVDLLNDFSDENEQLKSENKRLTDKLNQTALELVDGCISQGKATEISEMSYREFLDYRAKNGKPMELQK